MYKKDDIITIVANPRGNRTRSFDRFRKGEHRLYKVDWAEVMGNGCERLYTRMLGPKGRRSPYSDIFWSDEIATAMPDVIDLDRFM